MSYANKARRRALSLFERRRFLRNAATLVRGRARVLDDWRARGATTFALDDGADEGLVPSGR